MAGLVDSIGDLLQNERVRELRLAKGFRWLIVWLNVLGKSAVLASENVALKQFGAVLGPLKPV